MIVVAYDWPWTPLPNHQQSRPRRAPTNLTNWFAKLSNIDDLPLKQSLLEHAAFQICIWVARVPNPLIPRNKTRREVTKCMVFLFFLKFPLNVSVNSNKRVAERVVTSVDFDLTTYKMHKMVHLRSNNYSRDSLDELTLQVKVKRK